MAKKKRFDDSFKRPKPSIDPKPTGLSKSAEWNYSLPINLFKENMVKIHQILEEQASEEIYRYAVILIAGSLDKYIHDIIKVLLISIFNDKIPEGKNFDDFLIPMSALKQFEKNTFNEKEKNQILTNIIYTRTSQLTMQKSYSIERNLNYCLKENIFRLIIPTISKKYPDINSQSVLKAQIDNFIDRRNKIAHELDYYPNSNKRQILDREFVEFNYDFINTLVKSINDEIRKLIS